MRDQDALNRVVAAEDAAARRLRAEGELEGELDGEVDSDPDGSADAPEAPVETQTAG